MIGRPVKYKYKYTLHTAKYKYKYKHTAKYKRHYCDEQALIWNTLPPFTAL